MPAYTVLLVGPNKLSRAGLRSLFDGSSFTVIGEISDLDLIHPERSALDPPDPAPDIVLVECPGGSKTVLGVLGRLEEIYPDTPAVVLNDKVCMATLAACLASGASGFLTRDISRNALLSSLQLVALGETVFPTYLAGMLAHGFPAARPPRIRGDESGGLSERETDIVRCLLRGDSNKVIANCLGITEATIKVHMKSMLRKINASNRTQAAIWAYSHGYAPDRAGVAMTGGAGSDGAVDEGRDRLALS